MKTLIIYHSKNGTTRRFAENIAHYFTKVNGGATVKSIDETGPGDIQSCDLLVLGCWTKGRFLMNQKPDKEWVEFTQNMPEINGKNTVLFTTYNIKSGSMFRKMKEYLSPKGYKVLSSIKSRTGKLDFYSTVGLRYANKYLS